ncbi:neutral zinc metallopeptidase [Arthrobacter sp. R1-13]
MSRHPAAAVLAAAAMLVASCTTNPEGGTSSPTQTVTVTPPPPPSSGVPASTPTERPTEVLPSETATVLVTPTPQPAKTEIDVVAPAPDDLAANQQQVFCPGGTHEGCHTYDDMGTYLSHILALISPMFDELYGTAYRPTNFYYIASGQVGPSACAGPDNTIAPYHSESYMYCSVDQAIYTGQDMLWTLYAGLGDAAPAVGYAHEWGHHIQTIMQVPRPQNQQEAIQRENQADCIAGAWVYHAEQSGYLEYPDDVGDIIGLVETIGKAESDINRTHGTVQERADSVEYGYYYGLLGCNQYFPNTPIYNG